MKTKFNRSRSFDQLPFLLVVLLAGFAWWLIREQQSTQISTFQSPLPVLSYEKTVNKHEAKVPEYLIYNIIITNTGASTTDTLIIDQLAPEVTWAGEVTATYGTPFYDPSFRRIGWHGSLLPTSTLVISWSVVVVNVPLNPGNVLTNSFIAISDGTDVATRFAETIISTSTPRPTFTPSPTSTPTAVPTATATASPTPVPTHPSTATPTATTNPTTYPPTLDHSLTTVSTTPVLTPPSNWPKYLPDTGW
ncbi:MAG: hypothetical protein D6784_11865 [Chloroflexi bacterium]|nr:MAG: hypothetical protein D6784_11865 [Chloroflexota bacterium]